jgi:putative inorganic carbon (hco3(-)) transporter
MRAAPLAPPSTSAWPVPAAGRPRVNPMAALGLNVYLLFVASWFLHLGLRIEPLGLIRFDFLLVLACGGLALLAKSEPGPRTSGLSSQTMMLVLIGYAMVSLPFVEWPGSVLNVGLQNFLKAAVFGLFTNVFVTDERGLRRLLVVFTCTQSFRVLEPLYLHVTTGYWGSFASMGAGDEFMDRLAGAPSDIVNPNGLAFVIVSSLVFCHHLAPLSKLGKWLYLAYAPLAIWALTLTASRTGIVALAVAVGVLWLKSPRKLTFAAAAIAAIVVVGPLLPPDLQDRYLSIVSSDTKNAGTASGRSEGIRVGFEVAMRRPFFGHGLGTSAEAQANYTNTDMPAHNLFVEIAQELGFIGLLLFLVFIAVVTREVRVARQRCLEAGSTGIVLRTADAVQVFFWMNIVSSWASYGLSSYEWYLMAGLSAVMSRLALQAPPAAATDASTRAPGGLRRAPTPPVPRYALSPHGSR